MSIDFQAISFEQFQADFAGTDLQAVLEENDWYSFWDTTLDPSRATEGSMAYDLFAPFDFSLLPGEEIKIPTGCRLYIEQGLRVGLLVLPRSGSGFKYYVRLANTVGVIDSDYYGSSNEGHLYVKVRNESSDKQWQVKRGDAFAQAILVPYLVTDRDGSKKKQVRNGGFGSTSEKN